MLFAFAAAGLSALAWTCSPPVPPTGTGGTGGSPPTPDGSAPPGCGDLQPFGHDPTQPLTVLRGADGLTLLSGASGSGRSLGMYDATGTFTPKLNLDSVSSPASAAANDIVKAVSVSGTLAAVVRCQDDNCGANVYFSDRPSFASNATFAPTPSPYANWAVKAVPTLALGADRSAFVANLVTSSGALGIKKLSTSGTVLAEANFAYTYNPLAARPAVGNYAKDVQVDEQGRVIVLLFSYGLAGGGFGVTTAYGSPMQVVVYDSNLRPLGTWTPPSNVSPSSMAPDGHGHLVLAGTFNTPTNALWANLLDLNTRTLVWLSPITNNDVVMGPEVAATVTRNGDILLSSYTYQVGDSVLRAVWLQRYRPSGSPVWQQRAQIDASRAGGTVSGVTEQSDGSILLSLPGPDRYHALVFPPNATPPSNCPAGQICDCSNR